MYPRFPKNTVFIFDPDASAIDGDTLLIKINKTSELTWREFVIDPPDYKLHSIIWGASAIQYNNKEHTIVGVNILTLLHNRI